MQGKQKLVRAVVGVLAVVLVAAMGTASAVTEVCTTPPVFFGNVGDILACTITNRYGYGALTVTTILRSAAGAPVLSSIPMSIPPLQTLNTISEAQGDIVFTGQAVCEFHLTEVIAGYSTGVITIDNYTAPGTITAGFSYERHLTLPATCTPF